MPDHDASSRRNEREHLHERAADPADTANRPLEPRSPQEPLHETDTPQTDETGSRDPHHRLNTPVGEVDLTTDSDPYRADTDEDDSDRASGIRGEGERPDQ
jgi:hypothetical protein